MGYPLLPQAHNNANQSEIQGKSRNIPLGNLIITININASIKLCLIIIVFELQSIQLSEPLLFRETVKLRWNVKCMEWNRIWNEMHGRDVKKKDDKSML